MRIIYILKSYESYRPESKHVVEQKQSPAPASKRAKQSVTRHQAFPRGKRTIRCRQEYGVEAVAARRAAFPDTIRELSTRWRHAMPRLYCDEEDDLPF